METIKEGRTLAIVVAYFPERVRFQDLLGCLLEQADGVLVIDNTPADDDQAENVVLMNPEHGKRLRITRCGSNLGVGAALNIGLEAAKIEGCSFVVLNDQDSLPARHMISDLQSVFNQLQSSGVPVACVSPAYKDEVTGQWFGFQVLKEGKLFYSVVCAADAEPWTEVLSSITSGSLIPLSAIRAVGPMREDYFIDDIDAEWCFRARSKGFKLFGTCRAVMHHRLGDDSFPLWYLRWRRFNSYPPLRLYYRFRNFIALCREAHTPFGWKIRAGWYWLGNLYAYLIFSPKRWDNARYIFRGLRDGIRGRMGRFDG